MPTPTWCPGHRLEGAMPVLRIGSEGHRGAGGCGSGVRGTAGLWGEPGGCGSGVRGTAGACGESPGGCGSGVRGTAGLWESPGGCGSGVRGTIRADAFLPQVLEEQPPLEDPLQRVVGPGFPHHPPSPSPQPVGEPSPSGSEEPPPCTALENGSPGEPRFSLGFTSGPCRSRGSGPKNSRRKRDLVLSKLVHNVHNNITNQRRFNGSESIKSSWNIGVVKFLLEKLRHELVTSQHNYTDKELKGACVAYFLTKRREYRNSLNPFKGLKEKEEKKLRSGATGSLPTGRGVARLLGPEEQRLWRGVTEELMSDEEDSPSEPGVWVARPPRFRATPLTQLCYRLGHQRQARRQGQPGLWAAL
ncbi:unnamed protein product [Lepidochelys kempii]